MSEDLTVVRMLLTRLIILTRLDVDRASAAPVKDLKQRGLLDDTLLIRGGEFGRAVYSQAALTKDDYC